MATTKHDEILLYIGTYTRKLPHVEAVSEGIYAYRFNPSSGALTYANKFTDVVNPSYLALDEKRKLAYSVSEVMEHGGGAVSAYSVNAETGGLTLLNSQSSQGQGPCHVWIEGSGRYLLAANYGSGSIAALPIEADGRLGETASFVQHEGSSVNPDRQQGPHAHCIMTDAGNNYVFAADLGLDKIMIYRLDGERGVLEKHGETNIEAGAGPRHLDFHPDGRYLFLVTEMGSSVVSLAFDANSGTLRMVDTVSTLPGDFNDESSCAAIHVHPSGRYVYASNRGHDSIAILGFDAASGKLTPLGHQSTQGRTPRDFTIDPTGAYLLAANQDSGNIFTYRIDVETGKLEPTGDSIEVVSAVCLKWFQG